MPAVLLVVQAWLSLLHTVSASCVSNGTSQTFVDLWPIRGQPGQYRFPSFISTRKSVLLFASGPRGVEIRRSTDSGGSFSTPWQMRPTVGVAQAMYDPGTDAVLVLHRHPAGAGEWNLRTNLWAVGEQEHGRWVVLQRSHTGRRRRRYWRYLGIWAGARHRTAEWQAGSGLPD
jgi:hypothetical protein